MPKANVNGIHLNYTIDGPANKPALIFSNALGTDLSMWGRQAAYFSDSYCIIRYDTRGHGESGCDARHLTVEMLADDTLALLNHLDIEHAHFCGLSLGGLTGQALALAAPDRLVSLTLANTGARIPTRTSWNERIADITEYGMAAVTPNVIKRWFTPTFRTNEIERFNAILGQYQNVADPAAYIACCIAARDADFRARLRNITTPTLVIASDIDEATPLALSQQLVDEIPESHLAVITSAAHLSNVERPEQFNILLATHLSAATKDPMATTN